METSSDSDRNWLSHWLVEAVRLKESQWGPIEDAVEVRRVQAHGGDFTSRLLLRAQLLAQRSGWVELQQRLVGALRLSFIVLSLLFVFLGIGVALGALATQDGRVNVLLALVTFLGLPTVSLLLWFASFFLGGRSHGISTVWLWLSQRITKGPDQGLLLNALLSFSSRQRLLRWSLGAVNHWLWLLALITAIITVLALLATKRYHFNWETTLLSADTFVMLVQGLGVLPGFFGFATPSKDIILQSDGLQLLRPAAQVAWSSWLVGCLVVYGVLPRALAMILSVYVLRLRLHRLEIDTNQLGLIELRQRLLPHSQVVGVDAEAGKDQVPKIVINIERPALSDYTVFIGIELPLDSGWPPSAVVPTAWQDAGMVDSRDQRAELLILLAQKQFDHIVLCVDARQTPDRGVVAWLGELCSYGEFCSIYLMNAAAPTDLLGAWFSRLDTAGFKAIYTNFEQLLSDLS